MKKKLITAPTDTAISLAEAKAHLVVEHSDDDTLIAAYISQATGFAEKYTGLHLMSQTWDYYFNCVNVNELSIDVNNATSVDQISYRETAGGLVLTQLPAVIATDYYVDLVSCPLKVKPVSSWPTITSEGYNNFVVRVTSGFASAAVVPSEIKTALYLIVGHLYRNRESVTVVNMHELPMGVSDFLNKVRVISL